MIIITLANHIFGIYFEGMENMKPKKANSFSSKGYSYFLHSTSGFIDNTNNEWTFQYLSHHCSYVTMKIPDINRQELIYPMSVWFCDRKNKIDQNTASFRSCLLREYDSKKYLDHISHNVMRIQVYRYESPLKKALINYSGFKSWDIYKEPALPESLCFFDRNGRILLATWLPDGLWVNYTLYTNKNEDRAEIEKHLYLPNQKYACRFDSEEDIVNHYEYTWMLTGQDEQGDWLEHCSFAQRQRRY